MKNSSTALDNYSKDSRNFHWLLLIGIVLVGANLRAPLTSVGSLVTFIRDDLGISNALAGSLTTLPLIAFAVLSPFAPKIANRIGMEMTVFLSMILLAAGIAIRSSFGVGPLFIGTVFIGLAIAIGNVLIPGIVKMNFPMRVGVVTGIYAVGMNTFAALASGVSVPISDISGVGWKGSLAFWGILTMIALLVWLPQLRKKASEKEKAKISAQKTGSLWTSPVAWCITLFMGIQSLVFYTMVSWLPGILETHGYTSTGAGWMLSLMQFALIPMTFIVPVIAEKMTDQKLLSGITGLFFIVGIGGVLLGNAYLLPIAVMLIGMACGSAFSLSMMFFSLRTNSGQQAAEMSGMAQSFGYILAACGPVLFGALHDRSGGWTLPLIGLLAVSAVTLIAGTEAGKNRQVTEKSADQKLGKAGVNE